MIRLTRLLPAAAIGALLVNPAFAQTVDPLIAPLVAAWIDEGAGDFSDVVKAYGNECLAPVISALPEPARQAIIAAGGIEAGVTALQATDPATVATLLPGMQECIETMFVGEQIVAFVAAEGPADAEAQRIAAFCYMDAVRALPTEAKQAIVGATDFETGARGVVATGGEVGTGLNTRLEACG